MLFRAHQLASDTELTLLMTWNILSFWWHGTCCLVGTLRCCTCETVLLMPC